MIEHIVIWNGAQWRDIPGFPGYWVSGEAHVRGPMGGILKQRPNASGYMRVRVRTGGRTKELFVHKAVLLASVGSCPKGLQARHLDGNKRNNLPSNLKWGTNRENADDQAKHGTHVRGERAAFAKLTESQVREIRSRIATSTTRRLAAEYGVSHTTICSAVRGINWRHVA